MFSTPLTTAKWFGNFFQEPKVFTDSFNKKLEVDGKEFDSQYFSEITWYPNGTQTIHLSITIQNISEIFQKIRMNLTKTISSSELQNLKANTEKTQLTIQNLQSYAPTTLGNPFDLNEELWDGLYALVAPGSPSYWVKYSHDNNLWRYYPILENLANLDVHWDMKGEQKIHSHIARNTLQEWIAGNITDEEAMRRIIGTRDLIISIVGGIAISVLSYLYLEGLTGLIVGIIASAILSLILWLLSLLGESKTTWLINTVEAETNDGFCWSGNFHTSYFNAYAKPIGWLSLVNEYTAKSCAEILSRYHRIKLLCYEAREFQMSWGADRDASPQTYSTEMWYDLTVPAGIFADYSALSK